MKITDQQQSPPRTPRGVVTVCVAFVAVNAAAVAVCVAGALSVGDYRAFTEIENTYRCLMAAELFFVIFLWPLLGARHGAVTVPVLAALMAVSIPLVIIAAQVSNVPVYAVVLTHLLLLAVAAACVSACKLTGRKGERHWRYYYLGAAAIAGGLPLLQFLLLDLLGGGLRWLSCISPFWAMELAQQAGAPRALWAVAALVFAAIAVAGHALAGSGHPQ